MPDFIQNNDGTRWSAVISSRLGKQSWWWQPGAWNPMCCKWKTFCMQQQKLFFSYFLSLLNWLNNCKILDIMKLQKRYVQFSRIFYPEQERWSPRPVPQSKMTTENLEIRIPTKTVKLEILCSLLFVLVPEISPEDPKRPLASLFPYRHPFITPMFC